MSLFSKEANSLEDLFWDQIEDLYDAEQRLMKALPKMAKACQSPELRSAFQAHAKQTQEHVRRLERIFQLRGKSAEGETCEAMQGLLEEGEEMIDLSADGRVKDAGLIAAAQRVEHYEMAGYGTARDFARQIGFSQAADLLQTTLNEEGETDQKLTNIATQKVNPAARSVQPGYQAAL